MSTVTGNIVLQARDIAPSIPGHVVASALAIIAGAIVLFIGLIRAGWIVDFIPLCAISAFMTGSAISIAAGQIPTMLGEVGVNTRDPTYLVIIHTLQKLPTTHLDAAMGLTALAMLYIIRACAEYAGRRYPNRRKMFFFLSTLRTAFVILLYTMISWLANSNHRAKPLFKILGDVPRGEKAFGTTILHHTNRWIRLSKRRCAGGHWRNHKPFHRPASGGRYSPAHRAYCYSEVFRSSQQLHDQSFAGIGRHRRY